MNHLEVFIRAVFVSVSLILLAINTNASTGKSFDFKVKEVGSPDELRMYTDCQFDGSSNECHIDFGMKQTEYNQLTFYKRKKAVRSTESKDAFGKVSKCHEYKIAKLKLGQFSEDDFIIKRCEGKRLHEAVLGVDLFRGKIFEINYDRKQITFLTEPVIKGEELYLLNDGYIGLSMNSGAKKFKGLLDTGVGKTVIDKELVEQNKDQFELIEQSEVSTPTGAKYKIGLYKAKKLTVGSKEYRDLTVQAAI
jgi:hypothetical protein